jgi:hypothetical protein
VTAMHLAAARLALFGPLAYLLQCPLQAQELAPRAMPSQEWRDLSQFYRDKIEGLRDKRRAAGEKEQQLDERIRAMDWAKVTHQSKEEFDENMGDMAQGLGDAAVQYFKGPGKRDNVLEAGSTIITDVLPSFKGAIDAMYAPVDFEYEMDDLRRESTRYEREVAQFDKKIRELEREVELSEKIADLYEQDQSNSVARRQEVVFRLVDTTERTSAKTTKRVAARKERLEQERRQREEQRRREEEEANRIPPGWQACNCPNVHTMYGKVVRGVRYHAEGPRCPN